MNYTLQGDNYVSLPLACTTPLPKMAQSIRCKFALLGGKKLGRANAVREEEEGQDADDCGLTKQSLF